MPFYKSFTTNLAEVHLWKITEPEENLFSKAILSDSEKAYLRSIQSVRRKQEWLSVRVLLQEKVSVSSQILYHPSGAPYLSGSSNFISITHNKEFAVIALHSFCNVGVDVELKTRNFDNVATRYVCEAELLSLNDYTVQESLCLIWCAKEAAFKSIKESGVNIREHLRFRFIDGNQFEVYCTTNTLHVMKGYFYFVENSIVAVVIG